MRYETPQDAEDAFYDALEAADAEAMDLVWEDSEAVTCLLPMTPLVHGREVRRLWRLLFEQGGGYDIQVRHLAWIDCGELMVHLVEERMPATATAPAQPPIYGTNLFRRGPDGWRLLLHQNSPAPPPPESYAPETAIA